MYHDGNRFYYRNEEFVFAILHNFRDGNVGQIIFTNQSIHQYYIGMKAMFIQMIMAIPLNSRR